MTGAPHVTHCVRCCARARAALCRIVEGCLDDCVAHFIAALLTQLKSVLDEDIAAIRKDDKKIREFFAKFVRPEKVGGGLSGLQGGLRVEARVVESSGGDLLQSWVAGCAVRACQRGG
jgi:hypothetical protein